jgi:hypothetical protein
LDDYDGGEDYDNDGAGGEGLCFCFLHLFVDFCQLLN